MYFCGAMMRFSIHSMFVYLSTGPRDLFGNSAEVRLSTCKMRRIRMLTKQTLNLWRRVFLFISLCLLDRSAARLEEMVAWLPISVAYCRIDRSLHTFVDWWVISFNDSRIYAMESVYGSFLVAYFFACWCRVLE